MKKIYSILLAVLFVGFTTAVFAAPPGPGHAGPQGFQKHHGYSAPASTSRRSRGRR